MRINYIEKLDTSIGISRIKVEQEINNKKIINWDYFDNENLKIVDKNIIDRCNKLIIPPAWKSVWISLDPYSHIQAVGKDSKGRLQYKYHKEWTDLKSKEKYDAILEFARNLKLIRKKNREDLLKVGMSKEKVVSLIIILMDKYHIRVGNDEYARKNNSYGLTTLKEGHVTFDRSKKAEGDLDAILNFTGKSGKEWNIKILEDELALLIEASGKVGGISKSQDLFRYLDCNGNDYDIKSYHINEYLDEVSSSDKKITAKNFRTWGATWKTASRLSKLSLENSKNKNDKLLSNVIKSVSLDLGNTPSVCKSSYIHPIIIEDWENKVFLEKWKKVSNVRKLHNFSIEESIVLKYLELRMSEIN